MEEKKKPEEKVDDVVVDEKPVKTPTDATDDVPKDDESIDDAPIEEIDPEEDVDTEIKFNLVHKQLIKVKDILLTVPKRVFSLNTELFREYESLIIDIDSLINIITKKNTDIIIKKFNSNILPKMNTFTSQIKVNNKIKKKG